MEELQSQRVIVDYINIGMYAGVLTTSLIYQQMWSSLHNPSAHFLVPLRNSPQVLIVQVLIVQILLINRESRLCNPAQFEYPPGLNNTPVYLPCLRLPLTGGNGSIILFKSLQAAVHSLRFRIRPPPSLTLSQFLTLLTPLFLSLTLLTPLSLSLTLLIP